MIFLYLGNFVVIRPKRILISLLGFLNGGYMLLDGIYVILQGKYIGPDKPGLWASLFYPFHIDVFKLGPIFILFGLLWLTWLYAHANKRKWARLFGIIMSVLTLWYLPIGTLFSMIIGIVLLTDKSQSGS